MITWDAADRRTVADVCVKLKTKAGVEGNVYWVPNRVAASRSVKSSATESGSKMLCIRKRQGARRNY